MEHLAKHDEEKKHFLVANTTGFACYFYRDRCLVKFITKAIQTDGIGVAQENLKNLITNCGNFNFSRNLLNSRFN